MSNHRQNADISGMSSDMSGDINGFGEGGDEGPPWTFDSLLRVAMVMGLMFGVWSFAMRADERDNAHVMQMARAEAQRLAMPADLAAAYERGLADAVAGLQGTPNAEVLAQACMAQGALR